MAGNPTPIPIRTPRVSSRTVTAPWAEASVQQIGGNRPNRRAGAPPAAFPASHLGFLRACLYSNLEMNGHALWSPAPRNSVACLGEIAFGQFSHLVSAGRVRRNGDSPGRCIFGQRYSKSLSRNKIQRSTSRHSLGPML